MKPTPTSQAEASLADRFAPRPTKPEGEVTVLEKPDPAPFGATTANRFEFGVEFLWPDGRFIVLEYSHLYRVGLDSEGVGTLVFSRDTVRLVGRNLGPLLRRVKDHRQARIEVVAREKDFPGEREFAVYQIHFEEEEEEAK